MELTDFRKADLGDVGDGDFDFDFVAERVALTGGEGARRRKIRNSGHMSCAPTRRHVLVYETPSMRL